MLHVLGLGLLREDLGQGQVTLWPQSRVTSTGTPEPTAQGHAGGQRGRQPQPPAKGKGAGPCQGRRHSGAWSSAGGWRAHPRCWDPACTHCGPEGRRQVTSRSEGAEAIPEPKEASV